MNKYYVLALSTLATISIVSTMQYLKTRKPSCHERLLFPVVSPEEVHSQICDESARIEIYDRATFCRCPK